MRSLLSRLTRFIKDAGCALIGKPAYVRLIRLRSRFRGKVTAPASPESATLKRLQRYCRYDMERFAKYSSALSGPTDRSHWESILTIEYHKVEKALSLRDPRPGFGRVWIPDFCDKLLFYDQTYGPDQVFLRCMRALKDYVRFQQSKGSYHACESLSRLLSSFGQCNDLGVQGAATRQIYWQDVLAAVDIDYDKFVWARHSVRNFSEKLVDRRQVERAVELARATPSVCNRQGWCVYAYDSPSRVRQLLSHQRGNAGFGELVPMLLLVVADLSIMHDGVERFQPWIDGGMFSMSLIYALHSLGLGTCCLNLSIGSEDDISLRAVAQIKDAHSPLMMIAVGHPPATILVARSDRHDLERVIKWDSTDVTTTEDTSDSIQNC